MLKEKKKLWVYLAALACVVLVIVVLILVYAGRGKASPAAAAAAVTPRPTAEVKVREKFVEKLVEVEKEVSVEEISAGLNDMGVLVTQEYAFTDVAQFSSIKKLFSIELPITESSYLASYDGTVTAGVDFSRIGVQRDEATGALTVTLPASEILRIDIDPNSFVLYSEKSGLGNPISAADFNSTLVELEASAKEKAIARGVLERADDNARLLVRGFLDGLVGDGVTVRIVTEGA